ncbi:hypothetical protein ACVS9P_02330 [Caproicibacterium sp. NSD3]
MEEPLIAIRRLMIESNGLLTVAFRRGYIQHGQGKPDSNIYESNYDLSDKWITSPYCQIEPAMAFQLGLPILILKEKGVTGTYLPEFDLKNPIEQYFGSREWQQLIDKWEILVRKVVENKGCPPKLY